MKFQFWTLWGTIIALVKSDNETFYVSGKSKDEVIAKAYQSRVQTPVC